MLIALSLTAVLIHLLLCSVWRDLFHEHPLGRLYHRRWFRNCTTPFLILVAVLACCGCGKSTLAPDGVYAGNQWWFRIDGTLIESKQTLGEFVDWTRANYAPLHGAGRDDVIGAAESVRTNAPVWFRAAYRARDTYTNALFSGASPGTVNDASNTLVSLVGIIQSHARTTAPLTNSLSK